MLINGDNSNSSWDVSVDLVNAPRSPTLSSPAPEPVKVPEALSLSAVPQLNLAAVARAADDDSPPLLARNDSERDNSSQSSANQEELQPTRAPLLIESGDERYSDDDLSSDDGVSALSHVAVRASEKFSLLFSQINYSLIDGFAYISNDTTSVSLEQMLAFCRQYLNTALSEDDVREMFLEMDSDCDGRVSSSDWGTYFNRIVAVRDVDGATVPDTVHGDGIVVPAVMQLHGSGSSGTSSADVPARSAVLAAAAASGVELQESDISEELLATLQQLQQELIHGAAHALHLHSASSQQVQSSDLPPSHAS